MDWLKTFAKGHCTLWFSRIFNVVIDDLCYDHDAAYRVGCPVIKIKSDFVLSRGVWQRSERADTKAQSIVIKGIAVGMGVAVGLVGWFPWGMGKLNRWIDDTIDPGVL